MNLVRQEHAQHERVELPTSSASWWGGRHQFRGGKSSTDYERTPIAADEPTIVTEFSSMRLS